MVGDPSVEDIILPNGKSQRCVESKSSNDYCERTMVRFIRYDNKPDIREHLPEEDVHAQVYQENTLLMRNSFIITFLMERRFLCRTV